MKTVATLVAACAAAALVSAAHAATPAKAASAPASASAPKAAASKAAPQSKPVDINSASAAQLKKLPGIGDAEAERIVAGRPYTSKAELVTRNLIPMGVYQSLRHRIIALPPAKGSPPSKTHGKA